MPTAMSSWPAKRASSTLQAASSVMNRVASAPRPSSRSRSVSGAGSENSSSAPFLVCTAGRGRSVGSSSGAASAAVCASSRVARRRPSAARVALPGGEVGVLQRQRGQVGAAVVQGGRVQLAQVPAEHAGGPAVGDDVVHGQDQDVLVGGEVDQPGPQQRPVAQVERGGTLGASSASSARGRSSGGVSDRSCRGRSTGGGRGRAGAAWPSCSAKVVRSDSCRATSASRAVRRARSSSGPRRRSTRRSVYSVLSGSKLSRNHRRCWANDSGSAVGAVGGRDRVVRCPVRRGRVRQGGGQRGDGGVGEQQHGERARRRARRAAGRRRGWRGSSRRPARRSCRRRRRARCRAPRPTRRATRRSASVRGAVRSSPAAKPSGPGAGRARRSSLPLAVSGSASRTTKAAGTMCAGRVCARWARSSAAEGGAPGPAATT